MQFRNFRRLLLSASLLTFFTMELYAQGDFVYINNNLGVVNLPAPNTVSAFSVSPGGALTPVSGSPFATGGTGSGAGAFSGERAAICMVGNRLYVANQGSSDVSAFNINPTTGVLTPVPGSPFATGGATTNGMSIDRTTDGRFLIAANGGSFTDPTFSITVFSIDVNGALTIAPGSPYSLAIMPTSLRISPNGQYLSVAHTVVSVDAVAMFSIGANGSLTSVPGSPFLAPADGLVSGLDINCASNLLFAGSANANGTNVDVFSIGAGGVLAPIPGSPFNNPGVGINSSVVLLSPNEQFLFVSNQISNSITVFNVAANGGLSLVASSPFANSGGANPHQMATNQAGTLLYVNNSNGTISIFNIASNGSLTPVSGSPVLVASSTRPGIAAYPAAGGGSFTCPDDITVSNDPGQCRANVSFPPISSGCGGVVTCTPPSGSLFSVGTTTVTCSSGATQCSFQVTVNDTEAPVVDCGVAVPVLWSPNRTLVNVGLNLNTTDNCGAPTVTIQVFSDENDEGTAIDKHSPDAKNIAPGTLLLRAERKGNENGRVFLIVIKAVDSGGNLSVCAQTVVVPHDQSQEALDAVSAQAAAARSYALANGGAPPPGFFSIGVGPVIGPYQ
jgi:6-phosphogluconolactonase (cycloisomerase 2 family)